MTKTKKIVLSIVLTILLAVLLFCTIWCICNFNVVKKGLSGTQLYTKSDLDKAFNDGANQSLKEREEYIKLIDDYKAEIVELNETVSNNAKSIKEKDDSIANLQIRLNSAENLRNEYKAKYEASALTNAELKEKYELEQTKVANLNAELLKLKADKNELQLNLTNAQNRIAELNKTILGYENFIQGLIAENQVVAKFIYDNSLYSVMVLQKGDIASISNPQDTTYKKFLGWMVDNEVVDVTTYPINQNTTFVAKINTFHNVQFLIDDNVYDTDLVLDGSYAKVPTVPTKDGYAFDGWAIDNVVYDVNTYPITKNTVFVAKFTKLHTVKFVFKGNAINTQTVRNNEFVTLVNPELDNYTQLDYWTVNGIRVDVDTYPITSDTTFVAHVTNKYDVKFVYEDTEFNAQIVLDNGYPTKVTPTSTDYKVFKGWSLDKSTVVDYLNTPITANTTYYAVIDYYYIVTYMLDDSTVYGNTQLVLKDNIPTLPVNPTKDGYEFDYWTTDKTNEINPVDININADTTFYAKWTKVHTVKFYNGDNLIETKQVRDGGYVTNVTVQSTDRLVFKGWKLNNELITDISITPVTSDISYVAYFVTRYKVDFSVNGVTKTTYYIDSGSKAYIPENIDYVDYYPTSWTLDGTNDIEVSDTTISADTVFVAKFERRTITTTFSNENYSELNGSIGYRYVVPEFTSLKYCYGSYNSYGKLLKIKGTAIINGNTYSVDAQAGIVTKVGGYEALFSKTQSGTSAFAINFYVDGIDSFTFNVTMWYEYDNNI